MPHLFAAVGTACAVSQLLRRYDASLRQHPSTAPFKNETLDFDPLNGLTATAELLELGQMDEG